MQGMFFDAYTNICNILTSGCALGATYSHEVSVCGENIGEYADRLTDKLLVEHDPLASKVLARRIDESAQWLSTVKTLLPHTNRTTRRLTKAKLRIG